MQFDRNLMAVRRAPIAVVVLAAVMIAGATADRLFAAPNPQGEADMQKPQQFLAKLLGTRPTWPDDVTPDEEKVMQKHYEYMRNLVRQKKVLMAGPVFDFKFGLVIVQVASREEAEEILRNDPSVVAGLHTYELSEMVVSLDAHSVPPLRYAENPTTKMIRKEKTVSAGLSEVWQAWTTTEGVRTFFSPNANVDLRIGGEYRILFAMDSPPGLRGSEDCRILSYLPEKMFSFEWNAPPQFEELRHTYTRIVLLFDEVEPGQVKVTLHHLGWGEGGQWPQVYDYFDRAWGYVLGNFEKRFAEGPLDWGE